MTFAAAVAVALARALVVALAGLAVARSICAWLAGATRGRRRLAAGVLLLEALTPALLIGYAYTNRSLALTRWPLVAEVFYATLLVMKLAPIAVGLWWLAPPPPLTPQGGHCRRLLPPSSRLAGRAAAWGFALRGRWRKPAVVLVVLFLLAFQDFELASLLRRPSWTVWLFDAQAGGMALGSSLATMLVPFVLQASVLAAGIALLGASGDASRGGTEHRARAGARGAGLAPLYLVVSLAALSVVPALLVLNESLRGADTLAQRFAMGKQLLASLLLAGGATAGALIMASWCTRRRQLGTTVALCVPGLLGPLVVGLLVQALFQLPLLRVAYDTPLPLVLAWTLLVLPLAVVLRLAIASAPSSGLHLARLLGRSEDRGQRDSGARLVWSLQGRARLAVVGAVLVWTSFELVAATILAPVGLTPAPVLLYNLMHYGHSAVLSAMVATLLLAVVGSLVVLAAIGGIHARRLHRA